LSSRFAHLASEQALANAMNVACAPNKALDKHCASVLSGRPRTSRPVGWHASIKDVVQPGFFAFVGFTLTESIATIPIDL
jgi:hypothetical protein